MKTAEQYLAETMPNVIGRLENLEAFADKVDEFLFTDEPGKPALATIAYAVHRHVTVWCTYAAMLNKVTRGIAKTMKRVTYIIAGIAAVIAAFVAILHFFGFGNAIGQVLTGQPLEDLQERGTFGEYVSSVLKSKEFWQFPVMAGFGLLGVVANWFWKWLSDEIGSLWDYLWRDHRKHSIASIIVIVVWAAWSVKGGRDWTDTIQLSLMTGFFIDVLVNKAKRATIPPAREEKTEPPNDKG